MLPVMQPIAEWILAGMIGSIILLVFSFLISTIVLLWTEFVRVNEVTAYIEEIGVGLVYLAILIGTVCLTATVILLICY